MKNKAKHLLVFVCTALFLSLLTLIVLSAIARSHVEAAYRGEMTPLDKGVEGVPLYPVSEIIYLRYEQPKTKTIYAWVTKYTCWESSVNGRCINSNGERPTLGTSLACPRSLAKGSRVVIDEQSFVCDDRTALWVEKKFGDTYDIFVEDYQKAKAWGRRWLPVAIIE